MLKLENVTKSFGDTVAVNDVSLQIKAGEVVGFLGPNGAGKTTTMRMIANLLEPDSGTIEFNDESVTSHSIAVKERLGFMPENNPLYDDMLVFEYLDYVASLKGLEKDNKKKAIYQAVEETGVEEVFYRPIQELSKGFKQRVGLAQAIMHKPDLLILDEPTEGLDPNQRITIRDLIKSLGSRRTVVVSTHVLQEVAATCSRLLIINEGTIVADGSTEELIGQVEGKRKIVLEAEGLDSIKALESVQGISRVYEKKKRDRNITLEITASGDTDPRPLLFDLAKKDGWRIWEMYQESVSLEDVFRELTIEKE